MDTILIIVWEFPPGPGGIGQHAYSFAKAIQARNTRVIVITTPDYADDESITTFDRNNPTLTILRVHERQSFLKIVSRISKVWQIIRREMPTKIFVSGKGAIWILPLVKLIADHKIKISAFLHGTELQLPSKPIREFTTYCLRSADFLYPVSSFTKSLLPQDLQGSSHVRVVPNGLLLNDFEFQVAWSRLRGNPALLTVGQLSHRKGQHRVIKALPQLRQRWPDIHYHMVGLATSRESLLVLARQLNVEAHITIHGAIPGRSKLYNYYQGSDVFMMLSESQSNGDVEGFGIAILEANYFGKPAVGATGCGIEDAIQNGINGFLVDGNDTHAIEEAVGNCLSVDGSISADKVKRYAASFDWNRILDLIL